jgi:hypothetical protein
MKLANTRIGWLVLGLLFVGLLVLSIYSTSRVGALNLPVPPFAMALAIGLPITEVLGTMWMFVSANLHTDAIVLSVWVLSVLDGSLITLATSRMSKQQLSCALERTWRNWFHLKDSHSIRRVQDALNCCGLLSTKDQAYPFPDKTHEANACEESFGRGASCYGGWEHEARTVYQMLLVVGAVGLTVKIAVALFFYLRPSVPPMFQTKWDRRRGAERRPLLDSRPSDIAEERQASADHTSNAIIEHDAQWS